MFHDLAQGLGEGLAYGLVGTALLGLGFVLVDVLTPGKLGEIIWDDRNPNAALVLSASLLGVGAIVTTAIATSANDFGEGLANTAGYGLLGLLLMAVSFAVVDVLTPGRLGDIVTDAEPHPAAWITASAHVAVAAIVCAAIA
jgi:uncharacterized membrane protein YjfL (UPF0719 family)